MSEGIKALRKIQLGREATAGTAVAATTIWRGMGTIEDQRERVFPDEDIGYLGRVARSYTPKLLAAIDMEEIPATFEQLPHILEAGVRTDTPAQDGAGSGYIYEYVFPTTSINTLKNYTIEGGDNQQVEEMEYSFVESFGLSGVAGEAWKKSAKWLGRQAVNTTFTGALSVPSVEEILFSKCKLYIDDSGGTIGTTQVSSTLLEAKLGVVTGWIPAFTADGELYFKFIKCIGPELDLSMTFEHNATAVTEKGKWRTEDVRLVRLITEGTALGTAGTDYTYKTLIIDLAGEYESFAKIGEQDGNDVLEASFKGLYSSTDSLFGEITIVNELTVLP